MGTSASRRKQEELSAAISNGWTKGVREILADVSSARSSGAQPDDKEQQALWEVDLNAPLPQGYTPLQLAALKGCTEVVRLLLEFDTHLLDVDPNAVGSQKRTALHFAAASRKVRCLAELLSHGADPCIAAADDGKTPLDVARMTGCPRCVQAIEGMVVLWQGWVDHYEQRMLVIPSWRAKWLVILRDRRPNTGLPGKRAASSRPCSRCASVQPLPKLVSRFPCERCGTEIPVPASLQLALYELAPGATDDEDVDVSVGSALAQALPQDPCLIALSDTLTAFQSTISSKRQHAAAVRILDAGSRSAAEYAFRFDSKAERTRFFEILKDPQRASLEAEAAALEDPLQAQACWGQEGQEEPVYEGALPEPSAPPQSWLMSEITVPNLSVNGEPAAPTSPANAESENGVFVRCSVFPCGGPSKAGPEVLVKPPRASVSAVLAPMAEEDSISTPGLADRAQLERSSTSPLPLAAESEAASGQQALRSSSARGRGAEGPSAQPAMGGGGEPDAWTPPPPRLPAAASPAPPSLPGSARGAPCPPPTGTQPHASAQKLADALPSSRSGSKRSQGGPEGLPERRVEVLSAPPMGTLDSSGPEGPLVTPPRGQPTPPRCRTPPLASAPPSFPEGAPRGPPLTAGSFRPPSQSCGLERRQEVPTALPQTHSANAGLQGIANGSSAPAVGASSAPQPPRPPPQRRPSAAAARPAPAPPPAAPSPWN